MRALMREIPNDEPVINGNRKPAAEISAGHIRVSEKSTGNYLELIFSILQL